MHEAIMPQELCFRLRLEVLSENLDDDYVRRL